MAADSPRNGFPNPLHKVSTQMLVAQSLPPPKRPSSASSGELRAKVHRPRSSTIDPSCCSDDVIFCATAGVTRKWDYVSSAEGLSRTADQLLNKTSHSHRHDHDDINLTFPQITGPFGVCFSDFDNLPANKIRRGTRLSKRVTVNFLRRAKRLPRRESNPGYARDRRVS